ncbi:hypothetical protein CUJ86_03600 [Methanofollis fontis]|uniref:PKD domain-containing protein n=2 Tax=Methanofollis fontis TaxID=2052832 RepID=A0A483CW10_9EURY|nr:hypothetical protein CUJ86_03600 [Methanofollis fontis]
MFLCYGGASPASHMHAFLLFPDTCLTPTDSEWGASEGWRTIAHYGASYLWTLYLSEHYGDLSGDPAHEHFIKDLVASPANSTDGVNATLAAHGYEERFDDIFRTWVIANYLDDTGKDPLHGYSSINLVTPAISGNCMLNNGSHTFPAKYLPRWSAAYYTITTGNPDLLTTGTDQGFWKEQMPCETTVGVVVSPLEKNGTFSLSAEIGGEPSADFEANVTTGAPPLTVGFTDLSTVKGITTWAWDFGDAKTSDNQNPTHTYTDIGTYTVSLTVTDAMGVTCNRVKRGYISVISEMNATITLAPGWNFVSAPKRLSNGSDTVGVVFRNVDTAGHTIFTYDPDLGFVPMGPDEPIDPLDAVWVYANTSTTLPLVFESDPLRTPASKALSAGWNAIGSPAISLTPANRALYSIREEWAEIIGYNATVQSYEMPIINGGRETYDEHRALAPGGGYWIFVTENCTVAVIGQ